ncbi:hypothetical protein QFZ76_005194 [Streptomyces sp. V4I2]|nr:hypothetical protein [Streptomyces sp. V4I2]
MMLESAQREGGRARGAQRCRQGRRRTRRPACARSVGDLTCKNPIAALREALSNAFRYADASRIDGILDATVTLPDGRRGVRLTVGRRRRHPQNGRRSGLRYLERRAEALGGDSSHGPGIGTDGGGTPVVWQAPH